MRTPSIVALVYSLPFWLLIVLLDGFDEVRSVLLANKGRLDTRKDGVWQQPPVVLDSGHHPTTSSDVTPTPSSLESFQTKCNVTLLPNETDLLSVRCFGIIINQTYVHFPENTSLLEIVGAEDYNLRDPYFKHLKKLRILQIMNSSVLRFTSKPFEGLGESLEALVLSGNDVVVMLPKSFQYIPNVKKIDLSRNPKLNVENVLAAASRLRHLESLTLNGCFRLQKLTRKNLQLLAKTSIRELEIASCRLSVVERGAFEVLSNLTYLDISFNPISASALENVVVGLKDLKIQALGLRALAFIGIKIPTKALEPLSNSSFLTHLDLSYNSFVSVEEGDLPYLPNLKVLALESSGIHALTDRNNRGSVFGKSIPNIKHLILKKNWLTNLYDFSSLRYLKILDLSSMNTRRVETRTKGFLVHNDYLRHVPSLQQLDFSRTVILNGRIEKRMFYGLVNLQYLSLSFGEIQVIEDNSFSSLSSLQSLSLIGNGIKSLSPHTFSGLRSLRYLLLQHNNITLERSALSEQPFRHLASLTHLSLQRNKIVRLHAGLFQNLKNLTQVHLTWNKIIPWNKPLFDRNPNLKLVALQRNEINLVTDAMLQDIQSVEKVHLDGNPLDCTFTCELSKFRNWLVKVNRSESDDGPGVRTIAVDYLCHTPEKFKSHLVMNLDVDEERYCAAKLDDSVMNVILFNVITATILVLVFALAVYNRWHLRYWCFLVRMNVRRFQEEVTQDSYDYDAFVSFHTDEEEWVVTRLLPYFENPQADGTPRLRLCIPGRDFLLGLHITDNIIESIESSRKAILVVSNSFLKSQWSLYETHLAHSRLFDEKREALVVIQLTQLDEELLTQHLKYLIRTRTFIRWTCHPVGQKLFWERLKYAVVKPSTRSELSHIT